VETKGETVFYVRNSVFYVVTFSEWQSVNRLKTSVRTYVYPFTFWHTKWRQSGLHLASDLWFCS